MEDKMEDIGMRKENNSCILKEFAADEMGVGVIELVLILVVLIGLTIVFKKQINTLLENIFKQINTKTKGSLLIQKCFHMEIIYIRTKKEK